MNNNKSFLLIISFIFIAVFLQSQSNLDLLAKEAYERMQWDIRSSHILIRVNENAPPIDTLIAFNKITAIRNRLINGESFENVAIEVSEDPSARNRKSSKNSRIIPGNCGDLGYFTAFDMVYPFETGAYNTGVGEVSQPIRSNFGYHLIKVIDRIPAQGNIEAAHLFIQIPENATAEDSLAIKLKADSLYNRMQKGESFEFLIEEYSDDKASASKKGKLPKFNVNRMAPQIIQIISTLRDSGDISKPVLTSFGWHIIKLYNKTGIKPFEYEYEDIVTNINKDSRSKLVYLNVSPKFDKNTDDAKKSTQIRKDFEKKNIKQKDLSSAQQLFLSTGHSEIINSIEFSSDGNTVATASNDNTAKIWNSQTGKLIITLIGHIEDIYTATFSPDSKLIVTASEDATAKIWDSKSGTLLHSLEDHKGWVRSATFSPDGNNIVTASEDATAKIWDSYTGKLLHTLEGHKYMVSNAIYSHDGKTIITSGIFGTDKIWDSESGKLLNSLDGENASYSPDDKNLITSNYGGTVKISDRKTGKLLFTLKGHKEMINSTTYSPDSKTIVTASDDNTALIWDSQTGILLHSLVGHTGDVELAKYSPNGKIIVTGSTDGTAKIWDVKSGKLLHTLRVHDFNVTSISFSPDGKQIATASTDVKAKIWDIKSGKLLQTLEEKQTNVISPQNKSDVKIVNIQSIIETINIDNWDSLQTEQKNKHQLILPIGHTAWVNTAEFSPNGRIIATSSDDGTAKLWNSFTGGLFFSLEGHNLSVKSAKFSPDGKYIATASMDNTVKIWNTATGDTIFSFNSFDGGVNSVAWSPDNKKVAAASRDFSVKVFSIVSGKLIYDFKDHEDNVSSVEWSPDGNYLLSASEDKTAKVWSMQIGELKYSLNEHTSRVSSAKWSTDGKQFLTASWDGSIIIWDTHTGEELRTMLFDDFEMINVANWSPNSDKIVSGSSGGEIHIWDAVSGIHLNYMQQKDGILFREVSDIVFSCDGTKVISTPGYLQRGGKHVRIWDATTGELLHVLMGHSMLINSVSCSPDGKRIVTSSWDETAIVWDIESGASLQTLRGHTSGNRMVSESSNSNIIASEKNDHSIDIWDITNGKLLNKLSGHFKDISMISWYPDNSKIVSSSYDGSVKLWDAKNGKLIKNLLSLHMYGQNAGILGEPTWFFAYNYVTWSPTGEWILTHHPPVPENISDNSLHESILLINVESGEKLTPERIYGIDYNNITKWSNKSNKFIITDDNGFLIYDIDTRDYSLKVAAGKMKTADWSPDDTKIALVKDTNTLIFDSESGKLIYQLIGHHDNIETVSWSYNEKYIATTSDSTCKIWDTSKGIELISFQNNKGIASTTWSTEQNQIAMITNKNLFIIWDMEIDSCVQVIDLKNWPYQIKNVDLVNKKIIGINGEKLTILDFNNIINKPIQFITIDSSDYFIHTIENYYQATKNAVKLLAFKTDSTIYSFEQFDLKYNRPDIVLSRLGYPDSSLISSYYQAYQKRLKKMGFKEEDLSGEFHIPESAIENFEYMPTIKEEEMDLKLNFNDTKYNLDRYNLWINDVPVFGIRGKSLIKQNTQSFLVTETIKLVEGNNKIQVSCYNVKGAESYKETIEINYEPVEPLVPDLYVISISVSEYLDNSMNLKYAVKDGRDLTSLLSQNKDFNNIYIDTLFDQNATIENITSLKDKLLNSKVDDQVILFVSGHGLLDDNFDFYFASHDIDFDNPAERGISYDQLEWLLDSIPARKKLFMMDACHSGEVDKEELYAYNDLKERDSLRKGIKSYSYRAKVLQDDMDKGIGLQNSFELMQELFTNLNRGSGAVVISAAAGDSYALESDEWNNGVFTYSVLDGIKNQHADLNNDGEITVSELRSYVSRKVQEETGGRQKPTARQENVEFDFRVW